MPTAVLMITGQIAVMKITKIAEGWLSRKAASESGSQASGEHGAQHLEDRVEPPHRPDRLADQRAEQHADHGREAEADGDALERDQDAPAEPDILRAGPVERLGDQVLAPPSQILVGGGSEDCGPDAAICQNSRISATVTSGGTRLTRADLSRARAAPRAAWPLPAAG